MTDGPALVCVVDDDAPVREGMCNLLASAGYATLAFGSAEECLAHADLGQARIGLLDVRLPRMDGFTLHRMLMQRGLQMAVIFVSGHADEAMASCALQAGALALLQKPVDADTLLALVERALGAGSTLQ